MKTPTPGGERATREALAGTSTGELLTTAYALTHRIHEAPAPGVHECDDWHDGDCSRCAKPGALRAQRDLITAELLRRTGAQT